MRHSAKPLSLLVAALWLGAGAPTVAAHDFWIEPGLFRPAVGDSIPVILRVGENFSGTSQPYVPDWFLDFSVTDAVGRQAVVGFVGDDPAATLAFATAGQRLIGYHSGRSFVELEAARFEDYLRKEGLDGALALRRQRGSADRPGREYYSRCAKALVQVAGGLDEPGAGRVWSASLGYPLELLPLADPYALAPGQRLPLALRYQGLPLAGTLVVAFTAAEPARHWQARTDRAGRVTLPVDRAGRWLVKAVHMIEVTARPAAGDPDADWESFWASLTFDVRPAGAPARR